MFNNNLKRTKILTIITFLIMNAPGNAPENATSNNAQEPVAQRGSNLIDAESLCSDRSSSLESLGNTIAENDNTATNNITNATADMPQELNIEKSQVPNNITNATADMTQELNIKKSQFPNKHPILGLDFSTEISQCVIKERHLANPTLYQLRIKSMRSIAESNGILDQWIPIENNMFKALEGTGALLMFEEDAKLSAGEAIAKYGNFDTPLGQHFIQRLYAINRSMIQEIIDAFTEHDYDRFSSIAKNHMFASLPSNAVAEFRTLSELDYITSQGIDRLYSLFSDIEDDMCGMGFDKFKYHDIIRAKNLINPKSMMKFCNDLVFSCAGSIRYSKEFDHMIHMVRAIKKKNMIDFIYNALGTNLRTAHTLTEEQLSEIQAYEKTLKEELKASSDLVEYISNIEDPRKNIDILLCVDGNDFLKKYLILHTRLIESSNDLDKIKKVIQKIRHAQPRIDCMTYYLALNHYYSFITLCTVLDNQILDNIDKKEPSTLQSLLDQLNKYISDSNINTDDKNIFSEARNIVMKFLYDKTISLALDLS